MQTYKEFQPTAFDSKSNFVVWDSESIENIQDWLVCPTTRNRDSSCLDESNFDAALELLGGEGDKVQVHRFGHWACGWYELIVVHPDLRTELESIEKRLDGYPVLNEDDFSEREYNEAQELWAGCNLSERLEYLKRYGTVGGEYGDSIFSIRKDYIPSSIEYQSMIN